MYFFFWILKDYSVNYWIFLGVFLYKFVLGLGLYGRFFILFSFSNIFIGVFVVGVGSVGFYIGEVGLFVLYEVYNFIDMCV